MCWARASGVRPRSPARADEVLGDQPHGSPRAFLPRRIGRGVDDDLTHDPPAGVVGVTAGHEKPCERLGDPGRSRIGAVAVEMAERRAHATAGLDRPRDLAGGSARLFGVFVDPFTVLAARRRDEIASGGGRSLPIDTVREASPVYERGNRARVLSGGVRDGLCRTAQPPDDVLSIGDWRFRTCCSRSSTASCSTSCMSSPGSRSCSPDAGRPGLYQFAGGFLRYITRLSAYMYLGVDQYPPFNGAPDDSYPVRVHIAPPLESYSRLKVFFRVWYAILALVIRYAMAIVIGVRRAHLVVRDRVHRPPAGVPSERAELCPVLHHAGRRADLPDHRDIPDARRHRSARRARSPAGGLGSRGLRASTPPGRTPPPG